MDFYTATITLNEWGDALLIDGEEVYAADAPSVLVRLAEVDMPMPVMDALTAELERQMQRGYVELTVTHDEGDWWW